MVKIAVMVSSYAELQFDISEEINIKFSEKYLPLFYNSNSEDGEDCWDSH